MSRATKVEIPFTAVNLVVGIMVNVEGTRGCMRGQGVIAGGGGASTVEGEGRNG